MKKYLVTAKRDDVGLLPAFLTITCESQQQASDAMFGALVTDAWTVDDIASLVIIVDDYPESYDDFLRIINPVEDSNEL